MDKDPCTNRSMCLLKSTCRIIRGTMKRYGVKPTHAVVGATSETEKRAIGRGGCIYQYSGPPEHSQGSYPNGCGREADVHPLVERGISMLERPLKKNGFVFKKSRLLKTWEVFLQLVFAFPTRLWEVLPPQHPPRKITPLGGILITQYIIRSDVCNCRYHPSHHSPIVRAYKLCGRSHRNIASTVTLACAANISGKA